MGKAACPDWGHEWVHVNGVTICKLCDNKYHVMFPNGASGMSHAQPIAMELKVEPGTRYFIGGTLYQIDQLEQRMNASGLASLTIELQSLPHASNTQVVKYLPMPGYDPEHDLYTDDQLRERTDG